MLTEGVRRTCLSDVIDVYWVEARPIELSEVDTWITGIASQVVPRAKTQCSAQVGPRYRSALRLTFTATREPAAIGGVLASWPGTLEDTYVVHVLFNVDAWARMRGGRPVRTQEFRLGAPRSRKRRRRGVDVGDVSTTHV